MFDLHCDNQDPWTWDYQWVFNCMFKDTLVISPKVNLCLDIGFEREDSTHNKGANPFSNPLEDLEFPLVHPSDIVRNWTYDRALSGAICPSAFQAFKGKLLKKIARLRSNRS